MTAYSDTINAQWAFANDQIDKGTRLFQTSLDDARNFELPGGNKSSVPISIHTPALLNLNAINAISAMAIPGAYTLDTNGLFQQVAPDVTVGAFTIPPPAIDFGSIDSFLNSIPQPILDNVVMPVLTPITINPVPNVPLPVFSPKTALPNDVPMPINQQPFYVAEYELLKPEIKAFIDQGAQGWLDKYAPNFQAIYNQFTAKLAQVVTNGRMLRDDYMQYLRTQSRTKAELDYQAQAKELSTSDSRAGRVSLPQSVIAALAKARQAKYNNLSEQEVTHELKIIEMETDNVKWAVNQLQQAHSTLTQSFLSYMGIVAQVNEQASKQAELYVGLYNIWFENLIKRANLMLEMLKIEALIYETELKAALSVYEGIKLDLEAKRMIIDINGQQIQFAGQEIQLQVAKVQIYGDLLRSVETRAQVLMSEVDLYGKEVANQNLLIQGDKLRVDVYLAQLQGDEDKLKAKEALLQAWATTTDILIKEKNTEIAIGSFAMDNNKMLMTQYGYNLDALKVLYGHDELLLKQDMFNVGEINQIIKTQAAFYNDHWKYLASLNEQIGQISSAAGVAAANAVTSQVSTTVSSTTP